MSFDVANIWQKIDNSKCLDGKIRQKADFFSMKGRDLDDLVSWFCVYVDVEVVCVCRPSSRLCLEESSVHSMHFSMFKSSLFEHSTLQRLQPISLTFVLYSAYSS